MLSADLDDEALDVGQVRAAVSHAVAALEIVDSRVRDWDITITDTVADNGSSGMFVLGSKQLTLDEFEPADVEMSLCKDGEVAPPALGGRVLAIRWQHCCGWPVLRGSMVRRSAPATWCCQGPSGL